MPRPTVLALNLSGERQAKLRFVCMKAGVLMKEVPAENFGQRVDALCGLSPRSEEAAEAAFAEEMLIFCHMSHAQVDRFLTVSRQLRFAPVALKAVLTPTNASWTAAELCAELKREREAVMKGDPLHD